MMNYYEAAMQVSTYQEVHDFAGTAVGIYSRVSDPGNIILYIPGGTKPLGLANDQTLQPNGFTWRWLPLWLQRGTALVIVDMPSEFYSSSMPPSHRLTKDRLDVIGFVIEYIRFRYPNAMLSGYGHSYGSLEMSRLCQQTVLDSVVIGSGNWNPDPNRQDQDATVWVGDLDLALVQTPLLIVHHINDATPKCSYSAVKNYLHAVDNITVSGGMPHLGNPGLDPGPHFFHLQENEVVKNIVAWIRNKEYSKFIL